MPLRRTLAFTSGAVYGALRAASALLLGCLRPVAGRTRRLGLRFSGPGLGFAAGEVLAQGGCEAAMPETLGRCAAILERRRGAEPVIHAGTDVCGLLAGAAAEARRGVVKGLNS